MTQYKRKQALKENLPADFVTERKDEIESKWYTHISMFLVVLLFPVIILSDYLGFGSGTFVSGFAIGFAATAVAVFLLVGGYRIRQLANYYRRREIYTVLHKLDQASKDAASTEGSKSSVSAQDRTSALARESEPASAAA